MEVVDLKQEQVSWFPCGTSADVYTEGALVKWGTNGGVAMAATASGALDTTGEAKLAGIITGVNDKNQTISSTLNVPQITAITDDAAQSVQTGRDWFGQEGMFSKGDPQPLVQVALIDATTRIKVPVYNAAFGEPLIVQTVTTGSADGLSFTANASEQSGVADLATSYCRTGANAGLYRVSDDTSPTALTFDFAWPQDVAIGDTFVRIAGCLGYCTIQTDAEGTWWDTNVVSTSNGWAVYIEHIDLREAGKEHVILRFAPKHFFPVSVD